MGANLSNGPFDHEENQESPAQVPLNQSTPVPISEEDVHATKCILCTFLPVELVDFISDFAMYWPSIVSEETRPIVVTSEDFNDLAYLIGKPLLADRLTMGTRVNVKMVRFSLKSCDQGWGGEPNMPGPYHGSWSWFETAIFRATDPQFEWPNYRNIGGVECRHVLENGGIEQVANPVNGKNVWCLQRNARASSTIMTHEVVWFKSGICEAGIPAEAEEDLETGSGRGTGFVDTLVAGDRIAIIAKAKYPGWKNRVYNTKTEVFYSL